MLKTRPATLADEDRFMELFTQLMASAPEREDILRPAFRRLLDEPTRGAVLLVEDETVILGLITFSYNFAIRYSGFYAQIEELVVDEAAREIALGCGFDSATVAHCDEKGTRSAETGGFLQLIINEGIRELERTIGAVPFASPQCVQHRWRESPDFGVGRAIVTLHCMVQDVFECIKTVGGFALLESGFDLLT